MSKLKYLFNVLRHPVKALRSSKAVSNITKSPAFTDTIKKLYNDPNTRRMSFDDLESGAWKNASNTATKALTNYGDDVAKGVANYGDDALRTVDKMGDTLPDRTFEFTNRFGQNVSADYNKPGIWNVGGKTFHDLSEGDLRTSQNVLKEELLNKRTDRGHPYDFTESRPPLSAYFIPPEYEAVTDYDPDDGFTDYDLIEIPGTARPHKNTALGRWYANKVNMPALESPSFEAPPLQTPPSLTTTDAYGSRSIDGWTPYDEFPQRLGQRTDLIDSADFPDGFTNPDDFARYYDSVELGYSPAEFEDGMWNTIHSNDVNSMVLAHNLLKQQELNMPMSPRTFEQAKMLVNKYLEPGYYATKSRSMPNQQFVRQHKLDGTLYDLYDRILNAF